MAHTLASSVLVASLLLATACSGDDPERPDEDGAQPGTIDDADEPEDPVAGLELVTEGTLTVCAEASYPPFDYVDEDSPSGYGGFDIELIDAIAATADLAPVTVVEASFEDITSGAALTDGTCDVGASAIAITDARAERVAFTEPYFTSRRSLLVRSGSDIDELSDVTGGMVVGVQRDTAAADRASDEVEDAEIRTFADAEELFQAFDDGELDAVLHDQTMNRSRAEADDAEVVETYDRAERLGFAVALDRPDRLVSVLNDGLRQLRDDGTYDELFDRFFTNGS